MCNVYLGYVLFCCVIDGRLKKSIILVTYLCYNHFFLIFTEENVYLVAFSDKIRMTYMQLPLFNKEADECENEFERWIFVLKNMETLTRLPWAAQNAVFKKLEDIADVAALSRQERMKYDEGLRKYRDTISVLQGAREDGYAEGRKQEALAIAMKLKAMGMTVKEITEATGLLEEDLK